MSNGITDLIQGFLDAIDQFNQWLSRPALEVLPELAPIVIVAFLVMIVCSHLFKRKEGQP